MTISSPHAAAGRQAAFGPHRAACALLLALAALLGAPGCTPGDAARPPAADPAAARPAADSAAAVPVAWPVRAVTLDARRRPPDATLDRLAGLGATHLALIPFGFQPGYHTPTVRLQTGNAAGGGWYSETDAGIRDLCRRAAARGMGCLLKPHVWVGRYAADGQARDRIGFATEADWRQWEADYRRFLLHYARLAADVEADVLAIGTELMGAATARPAFWRALAADARAVYGGKLTYAANWYEEVEAVSFWDALDYVGVQAYYPLVHDAATAPREEQQNAPLPAVATLAAGWAPHGAALAAVHRATGRPVLFTEVGYRSVGYAARTPWTWPRRAEDGVVPPAPAVQARCYRALGRALGDAPWLAGAVVWKWHPPPEGRRPLGFTPQGKPAEAVLRRLFGGTDDP